MIAIALVGGVVLWLALVDRGGSGSPTSQARQINATAVSAGQLENLASPLGHLVFWVGPKDGYTYQLESTANGNVDISYLPPGEKAGSGNPHLTVATYPFPGAYAAIQALVKKTGVTAINVGEGGLGEVSKDAPGSVHVAFPGVDYQVEVFDPTPGAATAIVTSGSLVALGTRKGASGAPAAVSLADLRSLPGSLGQPIYWVGPRQGYTYELTRSVSGQIYLRYLPPGVKVGAATPSLTVAAYPIPGAFAAIQGLAKQKNVVAIKLAGGGLALIDKDHPTSIHLAYPGSDYQVEVYDPSPTVVQRLVESGQVRTIG